MQVCVCVSGFDRVGLLQNFVENFSEFSAAQRNAGKHVTIMSELSRLVDTRTLMQVICNLHMPLYVVSGSRQQSALVFVRICIA